jgi:oligosaccharide repeat unit polymerase
MLRILAMIVTMLFFGMTARISERSWTAPAVFFTLLWALYVLSCTYFFVDFEQMLSGVVWIALACGSVVAGTLVGHLDPSRGKRSTAKKVEPARFPFLRSISTVAVIVALSQILFMFARQGFSLRAVISYTAIAQLSALNRGQFIYGDQQQTVAEQIGFLCMYFGALTGGLLFKVAANKRERVLAVLNLILPATVLSLYGSRMGVLYGGAFWVSSYIAARVFEGGTRGDGRFFLRVGALATILLVGVQVLVQIVRYSTNRDPVPIIRMIADPFSFLAAFCSWFNDAGWQYSGFTAGARTFRRLVALVGIAAAPLPEISVGFTSSNIYTVFRDLIEDFGSIGALVVLFAYGYVARVVFRRARDGDVRFTGALSLVFAFALTSFSVSIFFYTATMLAAIAFALYCVACGWAAAAKEPEPLDRGQVRPPAGFRLGRAES